MSEQQKKVLEELSAKAGQLSPEGMSHLISYASGYADACAALANNESEAKKENE